MNNDYSYLLRNPFIVNSIYFIVAAVILIILILIIRYTLKSPFKYPYFEYSFDVSGKRKVIIKDYIDRYLISKGLTEINKHEQLIKNWKQNCESSINNSVLKSYRRKQYNNCLDENRTYVFMLTRKQTRYKQQNYQKQSYVIDTIDNTFYCDYSYLKKEYEKLSEIGFECTISEYHSKSQRKLVTPELRKLVKERDNYTCQICGKYMPDEVGLHIDHIKPISKGGKSVLSNLQVLCSKCNLSKSNKTNY